LDDVQRRHPRFLDAVQADASVTASYRHEVYDPRSPVDAVWQILRLALISDSFLALCCYRAEARCRTHRIPVVPDLLHRLSMMTAQVCIGPPVLVQPGLYLPHGQVIVDGFVELGTGVILFPFVVIGLRAGESKGPTIGRHASVGAGAKIIGPVVVGDDAVVGANAVVVDDVAAGATVVGSPARRVR
jgi:serine O-acetyltransferase